MDEELYSMMEKEELYSLSRWEIFLIKRALAVTLSKKLGRQPFKDDYKKLLTKLQNITEGKK